ncbi:MAG: hypothetical protein GWP05_05860 [Anaerolineaceae bacterium]|nr:hypothetical protein [Anaerolineaceae bacterium]
MRHVRTLVIAFGLLAATLLSAGAARRATGGKAGRWVALDISASMAGDVICTPNEYWRCVELLQLGVSGRAVPKEVFGGHDLAGPWYPSLSYTLSGGNYPDYSSAATLKTPRLVPAGAGLPPSGRVGIYQLYMDELEHPRWALSSRQDQLHGRNVIQFNRPHNKPDARMEIPLPPSQQKRYARINFLFAATDFPQGGDNRVRLLAGYADGTAQKLWQGKMSNVHGNAVLGRKKVRYTIEKGQREAIAMDSAVGSSTHVVFFGRGAGHMAMMEFEKPLPLKADKVLTSLVVESADKKGRKSWTVNIFAASVLPADR